MTGPPPARFDRRRHHRIHGGAAAPGTRLGGRPYRPRARASSARRPEGAVAKQPGQVASVSDIVPCACSTDRPWALLLGPGGLAEARGGRACSSTCPPSMPTRPGTWPLGSPPGTACAGSSAGLGRAAGGARRHPHHDGRRRSCRPRAGPARAGRPRRQRHPDGSARRRAATKVLDQAIVGAGYVLMAEALALAGGGGRADSRKLPSYLASGHRQRRTTADLPRCSARDFDRPFLRPPSSTRPEERPCVLLKASGSHCPVVETAVARYAAYVAQGNEMTNSASIARLYDDRSG